MPQVQHQPSLWPSSPLDEAVKTGVVDDLDALVARRERGETHAAVHPAPTGPHSIWTELRTRLRRVWCQIRGSDTYSSTTIVSDASDLKTGSET